MTATVIADADSPLRRIDELAAAACQAVTAVVSPAGDVGAVPVSARKCKGFAASIHFRSNPGFAAIDTGCIASDDSQCLIFVGMQELKAIAEGQMVETLIGEALRLVGKQAARAVCAVRRKAAEERGSHDSRAEA